MQFAPCNSTAFRFRAFNAESFHCWVIFNRWEKKIEGRRTWLIYTPSLFWVSFEFRSLPERVWHLFKFQKDLKNERLEGISLKSSAIVSKEARWLPRFLIFFFFWQPQQLSEILLLGFYQQAWCRGWIPDMNSSWISILMSILLFFWWSGEEKLLLQLSPQTEISHRSNISDKYGRNIENHHFNVILNNLSTDYIL